MLSSHEHLTQDAGLGCHICGTHCTVVYVLGVQLLRLIMEDGSRVSVGVEGSLYPIHGSRSSGETWHWLQSVTNSGETLEQLGPTQDPRKILGPGLLHIDF